MTIKKYDVRLLTHDEYELYFSYMTEEKQRRILAMRSENDRRRSVAADMLMRRTLSALTSLAERDIVISSEESGRPAAPGLPFYLSVSHSADVAVCAVSERRIGIDTEKIRPVSTSLALRFFDEDDREYVFSHGAQPKKLESDISVLERFFRVWTSREAYAKYTGAGLADIRAVFDRERITHLDFDGYALSVFE